MTQQWSALRKPVRGCLTIRCLCAVSYLCWALCSLSVPVIGRGAEPLPGWRSKRWDACIGFPSLAFPFGERGHLRLSFIMECSNYCTIALISHASKVMLKILQARLQQYINQELPDVQAGIRKGRGSRDHIANIRWIIDKAREFQKNIYFCFIDYANAFDCVDHN